MSTDAELLRRYATSGDEMAFRQIVERHVALVYASALRQVGGDRLLAEDVTQNVFQDLARHAGEFDPDSLVVRWLHRATRFAAANAVRNERRRRTRENAYAEDMAAVLHGREDAPVWDDACAQLDEAVNELHEQDRDAILLRYFQGLDLGAVGAALQTSGNTAQKRISRALEKLRLLLVQRGVVLSLTALAAFLSEQAAIAAPSGIASAIAKALASGSAATAVSASTASAAATTTGSAIAVRLFRPALVVGGACLFLLLAALLLAMSHGNGNGVPAGLVSWWTGDGHTQDATGRNPGFIEGNVTYVPGIEGQAFYFDGKEGTQLVVADHPSLDLTNQITLECSFRPDDDSNMGSIIAKRGLDVFRTGNLVNYGIQLGPLTNPQWGISAYYNDPTIEETYNLARSANGTNFYVSRRSLFGQLAFFPTARRDLSVLRGHWHHLVATLRQLSGEKIEMAIYFDGTNQGRINLPGSLARCRSESPLFIGGFPSACYKGSLDNIRIYNRALTGNEIRRLAARSVPSTRYARQQ